MSFINFARKEIAFKLVYYGPALCGKTTNLEEVHAAINPEARGELTMLSTRQDRTLFFDFLPLKSDIIKGFTSKFQLYTVPGQAIYNETRKLVLRNVDGIVFVADSQWEKMEENAQSFKNMQDNLTEHKMSLDDIPYMLQFNKRDLPTAAPVLYMDFMLNSGATRVPYVESVAREGIGVFETLNLLSKMVLASFMKANNMAEPNLPDEIAVPTTGG